MARVTVVVTFHNDAPFVRAALDSVLAQTYRDFDVVVVDDASSDGTSAIVESYDDVRIRLLVNAVNAGPAASRNRGIAISDSEYIAQLDGDDVCFPGRIARQVRFLDDHPQVAAVGAQAALINLRGRTIGRMWRPVTELGLRWCSLFQNPFINSSVAFRRSIVWGEMAGYDEALRLGDDFDLWCRVAKRHSIANLAETLVGYRADPMSISSTAGPVRDAYAVRKVTIICENLRDSLRLSTVPRVAVERWVAVGGAEPATRQDIADVINLIETSAARFASIHGQDADVIRHQASMFARVLPKAAATHRRLSLSVWIRIWRRDRKTAMRVVPRYALIVFLGETLVRLGRRIKRRAARRLRAQSSQ